MLSVPLQVVCIFAGYVLGSIPIARIITRFVSGKDILAEGSRNAGAMNSYRVTDKLWVGVFVALLDGVKGFLAVQLGVIIADYTFLAPALCGFFAIMGHNYSIFQSGRGGRGLATAAGVFFAINPVPVVIFVVMWLTGYFVIRRNIHVASMAGIIGLAILYYNVPAPLVETFMRVRYEKLSTMTVFVYLVCVMLFVRHLEPIRAILRDTSEENTEKKNP